MNLRIIALLFGIAFLGLGVAWHIPFLFSDGLLFGLFDIDSDHNKIHLASGLFAFAATTSPWYARLYFKLFGVIYLLLGVLGFIFSDQFEAMHINTADDLLHLGIGIVALLIGLYLKETA